MQAGFGSAGAEWIGRGGRRLQIAGTGDGDADAVEFVECVIAPVAEEEAVEELLRGRLKREVFENEGEMAERLHFDGVGDDMRSL